MPEQKFDKTGNTIVVLTEIANDILINEIKRRRAAKTLTDAELLEISGEQWGKAETDAENLLNK